MTWTAAADVTCSLSTLGIPGCSNWNKTKR